MIISHKYKFIFIRTKKTASTSLQIALSEFCGPNDVVVPTNPQSTFYTLQCERAGRDLAPCRIPLKHYSLRDIARLVIKRTPIFYRQHMPAEEVRKYVGSRVWDSYFKFCFERDPWDKFVSWYFHRTRPGAEGNMQGMSLSDFFLAEETTLERDPGGFRFYSIDGLVAVDRIFRYERMEEELDWIAQHLGLPKPLQLPQTRHESRTDRRHYSSLLSPEQRQAIGQIFHKEIDRMGYEYQATPPTHKPA